MRHFTTGLVWCATAVAGAQSVHAGLKQDLAACTSGSGLKSTKACTRVINSGRLRKADRYIAYFNRGWGYRNAGRLSKAEQDFDRTIALKPAYADSYYSRAVVYYDRGNEDKALSDLAQYVARNKDKATGRYKRALMLRRLGKRQRALDDLAVAIKSKSVRHKAAVLHAIVRSDMAENAAALTEIDDVVAGNPKEADARYARALILYRLQRFDEAKADAEDALRRRDGYTQGYTLLGRILEKSGRRDAAKRRYEQAIAAKAESVEDLYSRAEARDRLQRLARQPETEDDTLATSEDPAAPTQGAPRNCRRFIPSAGLTVAVPCSD